MDDAARFRDALRVSADLVAGCGPRRRRKARGPSSLRIRIPAQSLRSLPAQQFGATTGASTRRDGAAAVSDGSAAAAGTRQGLLIALPTVAAVELHNANVPRYGVIGDWLSGADRGGHGPAQLQPYTPSGFVDTLEGARLQLPPLADLQIVARGGY